MIGHPGNLLGTLFVLVAVIAGLVLVGALYAWDAQTRAASGSIPTPASVASPRPQTPGPTAIPGGAIPASPVPTAAAGTAGVAAGRSIFMQSCQGCHPNGDRGVGPALKGAAFQQRYPTDASLAAFIRQGQDGMPAFSPAQIDDTSLANLIAYIRTLQ